MSTGLERLFAKRKFGSVRKTKSHARHNLFDSFDPESTFAPSTAVAEMALADEYSLFPQPSFIRPTTSRMVARDEASPPCKQTALANEILQPRKTGCISTRSSCQHSITESHSSGSSVNSTCPRIPRRSSSLSQARGEQFSLASLVHYEFTERESKNAERSLSSLCASTVQSSSPRFGRIKLEEIRALAGAPTTCIGDTPPPSDHEASNPPSPLTKTPATLLSRSPFQPARSHPTPGPSPDLSPVSDLSLPTPRPSEDVQGRRPSLRSLLEPKSKAQRNLAVVSDDSTSNSPASSGEAPDQKSPVTPAVADPILQEPAVGEFLGLSDDDIAESQPPSPELTSQEDFTSRRTSMVQSMTIEASSRPTTPRTPARQSLRTTDLGPMTSPSATLPPSPRSIRRNSAQLSGAASSRAAAMAAFEVARIASRYNFDLIYVINLWPHHMTCQKSPTSSSFVLDVFDVSLKRQSFSTTRASGPSTRSSTQSSDSEASDTTVPSSVGEDHTTLTTVTGSDAGEVGFNYRFLAAYGLHTVKPPLTISYGVHSKILKNDGWIEYRQAEPREDEFARGYACSFHTGYAPSCQDVRAQVGGNAEADVSSASSSPHRISGVSAAGKGKMPKVLDHMPHEGSDRSQHNRGIVFAAYRKPRPNGTDLALDSTELAAMQQDAQGLVDMIVQFHIIKRRLEEQKMEKASRVDGGVGHRGESLSSLRSASIALAAAPCGSIPSAGGGGRGRASI